MIKDQSSPENRMLHLFTRLRNLDLDHCPDLAEGVSPAQMTLLAQIVQDPGCGVQDVAEQLGLSAPTVSVGMNKLEENGLVKREPHPTDKRAVQFFTTAQGQSMHDRFSAARLQKFKRLLSGLNPQDKETLLRLLSQAVAYAETGFDKKPTNKQFFLDDRQKDNWIYKS
jgi:DNA-binding MarR family transcriptional regulator